MKNIWLRVPAGMCRDELLRLGVIKIRTILDAVGYHLLLQNIRAPTMADSLKEKERGLACRETGPCAKRKTEGATYRRRCQDLVIFLSLLDIPRFKLFARKHIFRKQFFLVVS